MRSLLFPFIVLCSVIASAQVPIIDRELFFGDPEISGAQISPDGKFISFLKPYNNVRNIWVKKKGMPFDAATPVTADTTRPVTAYFWTRDAKYILYVQDKGGDENFHIYALDPSEPGTPVPPAKDLTPLPKVRAFIYNVPIYDPNILFIGLNDRKPELHDVYRLSISTGERTLVRENNENVAGWEFDLQGHLRIGIRQTSDGGTELLQVTGDSLRTIYSVTADEEVNTVRFTPDGGSVYISTNKGAVDKTQLELLNLTTLASTLVEKDPKNEVDFGGALFSDVTNKLLATIYVGDRERIYFKDKRFEKDFKKMKAGLPDGEISLGSMTADENQWVVTVSSDVDPGSRYLFDRRTGKSELLYRSRPKLNSKYLAPMKPLNYTARDGMLIHGYLTVPAGSKAKRLPTIIFVHGGPWSRDQWGYNPIAQFLANRGYAVFMPNFRGSTGFGKQYLNAGNKQWGTGSMQHDITDAVHFLIDKGIADPKRIGISGGSYGGYATLAGLAFTPDLYAAGFDIVGPSNIITLLKSIPPYWAPVKKMFAIRVGDMDKPDEREMLEKQSPLNSAERISAPLFVAQGANDPRVKKAESDRIVSALHRLGRAVEYMVAPDEGHGYAGRENRIAMFVAMEKFFAKHLGGRVQKEVPDDIQRRYDAIMVDVSSVQPPESAPAPVVAAVTPVFNPSLIAEGTFSYDITLSMRGQKLTMSITRAVQKQTRENAPILQVVEQMTGAMGSGVDTIVFNGATLYPIRRSASQGPALLNFEFSDTAVTGMIRMQGQAMPINASLDAPVLPDASSSEVVVATLPLAPGYTTTITMFETMQAAARKYAITCLDTEQVTIAKGTFDAFKVSMAPVEGDGMKGTFWVSRKDRVTVKGETTLPAAMGGGTMTSELK